MLSSDWLNQQTMMQNLLTSLILLVFAGCASKPLAIETSNAIPDQGNHQVHVLRHRWHTGFVLSSAAIEPVIPELKRRFPDATYLLFGWGDEGVYPAQEITSGLATRALLWPTDSVMHAVALEHKAELTFANSEVFKLCFGDRGYAALLDFIAGSFHRNADGGLSALKKGLYGDSQFYRATGTYHLMNTCNNWTAKGLKSAGMDISPGLKLTAGSVMRYLDDFDQKHSNASPNILMPPGGCP